MAILRRTIDAVRAREARLLLDAAGRCLKSLEHPSGWKATHEGEELLSRAVRMVTEALTRMRNV